jgi:aspartyl-tRNA synthetase
MALRTHYAEQVGKINKESAQPESIAVAGWVHDLRNIGKIAFIILRDRTGFVQVTLKPAELGQEEFERICKVPRESVISAEGRPVASPQAKVGAEVIAKKVRILSESSSPLPLGVADKVSAEMETRLNHRTLDIRKPEITKVFVFRDAITREVRRFMRGEGFIEVQTPKFVSSGAEGGATLFKVEYYDRNAYLAQSPQLYKQALMGAGLDRVFEILPAFRAEPSDTTRHITEFSSFDAEMAFISGMEDVLKMLEGCMKYCSTVMNEALGLKLIVPAPPIPRVEYENAVNMLAERGKRIPMQEDIDTEGEKLLGEIMKEKGHTWYFITKYPAKAKPFYIMEDGEYSWSFDLSYGGLELASGGQREHRARELVARMEGMGLDPAGFESYIEPFRFGMPPHGGWGLGMDRLVCYLLGLGNVREAILFPRDRHRLTP